MQKDKTAKQIYWEGHLATQEASGQSQKAYRKEQGLNKHTWGYWKRKLKTSSKPLSKKQSSFVEVTVSGKEAIYEVIVSEGSVIRLSGDFDLVKVKGLIEIVEVKSC